MTQSSQMIESLPNPERFRKHGMNVQVIACSDGTPLWFSRAMPGRTHDLTAPLPTGSCRAVSPGAPWSWPTARTRAPAPRASLVVYPAALAAWVGGVGDDAGRHP